MYDLSYTQFFEVCLHDLSMELLDAKMRQRISMNIVSTTYIDLFINLNFS